MALTYDAALDFLFPRVTTIKFGLETTRALLRALGSPEAVFPVIHVGGTNGKGSVSTLVAEALRASGRRVGLYTSPHLVSFRERIRVDGEPIGEAAVAAWTTALHPHIVALEATFFEATTAIAFADFAARGVELAVVEVGLGGRLDSTNVVQPLVSAVTKIALDHQKYLGETHAEIAREKAGIAKPEAPFVIGETDPAIARVLEREAGVYVDRARPGAKADVRLVPPEQRWTGELALLGDYQRRNAAVAAAILRALPPRWRPDEGAIAEGFARARIPGRLDRRGRWLFDVAHNPDGVAALVATLPALDLPRPLHALVSVLGDKDWPEMLALLDGVVDRGVLTVAPTAAARRWDLDRLRRWLDDPARPARAACWRIEPDFGAALRDVQAGAGTALVTGSFHTVGDAMEQLGMSPV